MKTPHAIVAYREVAVAILLDDEKKVVAGLRIPHGFAFGVTDVDPDYVRLDVSASDGLFAGFAEVYGGLGLVAEIAMQLTGFPASPTDRREIVIGPLDPRVAGGSVSFLCVCVDRAGHPVIEIQLRDKYAPHGLTARAAVVRLRVEAPAIDEFVQSLKRWDGALGSSVAFRGAT